MDSKKVATYGTMIKGVASGVKKPTLLKDKKQKNKEDEERKRLEEEERMKREQEEREKREKELKEIEETKRRELTIVELKRRELTEFYDVLNSINQRVTEHNKLSKIQSVWNRYMVCDGSPNPTIPTEINTFLTLWREDKENNDLRSSLSQFDLSLRLIEELSVAIKDLPNDENSKKKLLDYQQKIKELEYMTWVKINESSHKLLCGASNRLDPETFNFDHSYGDEQIYFCHWANISHNQKIKEFTFSSKDFSFILPRFLTLAHVAIRVLFMSFDIYSKECKTFKCRVTSEHCDFDPIPIIKEEKVDEPVKSADDEYMPPELRALMDASEISRTAKENEDGADKLEESNMNITEGQEFASKSIDNLETKKRSQQEIDEEEAQILHELSDSQVVDLRNFMPVGPILHFGLYHVPPQPKVVKDWTITQMDYTDVLTAFPYPQSDPNLPETVWNEYLKKKLNDTHDESTNMTTITQDLSKTNATADMNKSKKSDANTTARSDLLDTTAVSDEASKAIKSSNETNTVSKLTKNEGPIEVHYILPNTVYYGEVPQLARWDNKKKHWRLDEIMSFQYNEEEREIRFKTYHFSPYCILQDRHVHMPFQSWRLTPKEQNNNCVLNIETGTFTINIEILNDQVQIFLPPKKPVETETKFKFQSPVGSKKADKELYDENTDKFRDVVEPFANKWFPLETLINILKSVGLNLFPEPDSEKFVTITAKDKKLEWTFYRNMAACASVMTFSYSRWNMEINDERRIVVLSGLHNFSIPFHQQDNYNCLITTSDLYKLSESNESSEELSEILMPGIEEHADLYHLCFELAKNDPNLINRVLQIDPLFYDTCVKLLEATKIVTYS